MARSTRCDDGGAEALSVTPAGLAHPAVITLGRDRKSLEAKMALGRKTA